MKKLAKIVFGVLGVCVLVIVAAAIILPIVVSPNDYKPQIVEAVKQHTGRDLVIEGDIGLSVFPKIGLTLGRTSMSNAQGFTAKTFASVEAVNIHVALMPLLDKKVDMDEVVLEGLRLNLHKNKSGITNWDDITAASSDESEVKKESDEESGIELEGLVIGGIRIKDAEIQWQDDTTGQQYSVKGFDLQSGALSEGKPVELTFETDFKSTHPAINGRASLTTTVLAELDKQSFTLGEFKSVFNLAGEAVPGGESKVDFSTDNIALNLDKQSLAVNGLSLGIFGVQVAGSISGRQILAKQPQLSGKLKLQPFNARELIQALGQAVPDTADQNVLTRVALDFDIDATPSTVNLKNLLVKLDDSSLKGRASVKNFANPTIGFDLTIDKIDLDRYLPAPAEAPSKDVKQSADPDAELFPVDTLRKLNASGVVRIAEVKVNKLTATDVRLGVNAKSGKVNLKPSAKLYQGNYESDVTVDARTKLPKLSLNARLAGVQIEPLLKDMQGEAKLAGQTDATINIRATGNSQAVVKKTLNGKAVFSFQDGALVGVNIAKIIREGMAKIEGKSIPKNSEPEKTDFSALNGTANITNGVVDNRDFILKSPLLRINGAGTADLVKEKLDYQLKTAIVGSLQGQGGEELKKIKGITIPVRVKGPFADPSITPDLAAALSESAKKKVEQAVEKKKDDVKKKLEDKLKDKFKGLF